MDQIKGGIQAKSLDPESEDEQEIEDTLESLKEHLKECQKLGKYVEAQMTQNRLQELKEKLDTVKLEKFKRNQDRELAEFDEKNEKGLNEIEEKWNEKRKELSDKIIKEEQDLIQKHQNEINEARHEIESKVPEKAHASQEIVALKKMEEAYSKQGKFEDAHKTKMEAMQKEKMEQEAWNDERENKIQNKLQVILTRQENEMKVLKVTHEKAYAALEKNMLQEIDQ